MTGAEQRTIKLGRTDGFRYIAFQPPLTEEELDTMPLPETRFGGSPTRWSPYTIRHSDNSQDLGFDATSFQFGESFTDYARRVAEFLGNCTLDVEVREVGPGSIIAQANGAQPKW